MSDRLHFHQLVRFLKLGFLEDKKIANPVATLVLIPLITTPQILGILFWDNFGASVLCTICVGLLFVVTYLMGITIAKTSR